MLTYHPIPHGAASAGKSGGTVWVDLSQPTDDEIKRVEEEFDVRVPSREQLDETMWFKWRGWW